MSIKKNISKPAPKWFRKLKRIIYLLTASSILTGTLSRFDISEGDTLLIIGWMLLGLEILNITISNGEVYAKADSENLKEDEFNE